MPFILLKTKLQYQGALSTRCDQKVLALYALVRFIELKSLSVGHLINLKDIGSVKRMRSCLVVYVKHLKSEQLSSTSVRKE